MPQRNTIKPCPRALPDETASTVSTCNGCICWGGCATPLLRALITSRKVPFMLSNLSVFNIIAVGLYLLVALAGVSGMLGAMRFRQARWHLQVWLLLAAFFLVLAVLRGLGIEDMWQSELRAMMKADGAYQNRRDVQRPLAAGVIAFAGLAAFIWSYRGFRNIRGRRNVAVMVAGASAFVMIALVALRLISLHPVDALLYGSVKLNWIIDIGSSLVVLGAAGYYLRVVSQRP